MSKTLSFLFIYCFVMIIKSSGANASRSDTIDIRKTIINLTITDFTAHIISARTTLDIKCLKNNINEVVFDLEGLTVDSVLINGITNNFNQVSNSVHIMLTPLVLNINDSALVDVYYHGVPVADLSWGGFSFSGNYAYQLGVGISAQPHSFGRTWHPCFDNFVERCRYEFFITTEDTKVGICNGILLDSMHNTVDQTKTWHWKLDEEIPSYLACVAVSNYVFLKKNLTGLSGNVEALITCEAADSNNANASFSHLGDSFNMLEEHFGMYSWSRVGYSLVPFGGGAMEHATNISIGKPFINGTLDYETLIAHELSHHWWGNLVTCSSSADMWLNEGFASYCEPLHTEKVYGYKAYLSEIKTNHFNVLSRAHVTDQGYRAIANMDSLYTYGMTVYSKAEDAIHSLRTYMGDTLFFNSLKSFLNSHKFQSINTIQLRDYLIAQSGIDLNDYFNDWILTPGFTHFSIDSFKTLQNGSTYDLNVFLRQRKHHSTNYYEHVPLEIAFYDSLINPHIYRLDFTGRCMQFNVNLPFNPVMIVIDPDSKISDAVTEEVKIVKVGGSSNLIQAKCLIKIKSIVNPVDSSYFRAEHHWVAPDRFKNQNLFPGYVLCDNRYWKIDGIHLENINGTLQFTYDASSTNNYLDSSWIKNTEDSIRLFYRKDASEEWQFANDSLKTGGSITDKYGNVYAKEIKKGEYTFGIKKTGYMDTIQTDAPISGCNIVTLIQHTNNQPKYAYTIYPNPVGDILNLWIHEPLSRNLEKIIVELYNSQGQIIQKEELRNPTAHIQFVLLAKEKGLYLIKVSNPAEGSSWTEKIIKH